MNHAPQSYFDQDKLSPVRGSWGAPIMGPQNLGLERDNPDMLSSPADRLLRCSGSPRDRLLAFSEELGDVPSVRHDLWK
jgi:hypothetical protein